MTMRQRLARALDEALYGCCTPEETPSTWQTAMGLADTALETMREPTIEMANAPYRHLIPKTGPPAWALAYRHIIDAALKDQ